MEIADTAAADGAQDGGPDQVTGYDSEVPESEESDDEATPDEDAVRDADSGGSWIKWLEAVEILLGNKGPKVAALMAAETLSMEIELRAPYVDEARLIVIAQARLRSAEGGVLHRAAGHHHTSGRRATWLVYAALLDGMLGFVGKGLLEAAPAEAQEEVLEFLTSRRTATRAAAQRTRRDERRQLLGHTALDSA